MQRGDAIRQVIVRNELRMFARDEQDVAKALRRQRAALRAALRRRESVTRRIGLSREKPQYLQLLMHSLER